MKAWLTAPPGGVTTIHANNARAVVTRLSSLVQETGVPSQPELIAETIQVITFISMHRSGTTRDRNWCVSKAMTRAKDSR